MKPISVFLFAFAFVTAMSAEPIVLSDGAYQLIRARGEGDISGGHALSAVVVNILNKQGKIFVTFEGIEAEVRTDDQQGFVVSVPYRPEEKGRLAAQLVLAGRSVVYSSSKRIEGRYFIIWSSGAEKGEFALDPISPKNG